MALKRSLDLTLTPPEYHNGQRIFLEELFYPEVRTYGLPEVNYRIPIVDTQDLAIGQLSMSPLRLLTERKELRKWWSLTESALTVQQHRHLLEIAQQCRKKAISAQQVFRDKFSWVDFGVYRISFAWQCFPTALEIRNEAMLGMQQLDVVVETGERIAKAHMAMLKLSDWAD